MHQSVLLKEVIDNLKIKPELIYVDATLGYAGHSSEVLNKLTTGHLYAFDQDESARSYSQNKLSNISPNFTIIPSNFVNMKEELAKLNINKVNGIMFDLGVSSPQLDEGERGFSYHSDARLDMRMDQSAKLSAYEVVNNYEYHDLVRIFYNYGEEKYSTSIAKNIIKARDKKPIVTTLELVDIIKLSVPEKYKKAGHPARKIFQAIRIEVNKELEVLSVALEDAINLLAPKGRLCVITFHSLEDKMCKQIFRKYTEVNELVKGLPNIPKEYEPICKLVNRKPIEPSIEELETNNRSRSAKLRVIEKI